MNNFLQKTHNLVCGACTKAQLPKAMYKRALQTFNIVRAGRFRCLATSPRVKPQGEVLHFILYIFISDYIWIYRVNMLKYNNKFPDLNQKKDNGEGGRLMGKLKTTFCGK